VMQEIELDNESTTTTALTPEFSTDNSGNIDVNNVNSDVVEG
jgi:hypothetical protein